MTILFFISKIEVLRRPCLFFKMNSNALYHSVAGYHEEQGPATLVCGILILLILIGSCLAPDPKKRTEEINNRNSKLAIMLMMKLMESPEENENYIQMAKNIGYDHLLKEL